MTLKTDVYGMLGIGFFGSFASAGYNLYVAALAGAGSTLNWYQLNATKQWSSLSWPMAQFMSGVSLNSRTDSVVANIFQDMDVSQLIGSHIYVGYGTDANEMASAKRYREIMTISK